MGTHPIFESDFDCLTDMSSAHEIRQKFEKSEFFKKIATSDFGQNIAGHSGSFYGINSKQDKIICQGISKLSELCSSPIHNVSHIILNSETGGLALFSSVGLSILNPPILVAESADFVKCNLGRNYLRQVRWGNADEFHVLISNNSILSFKNSRGAPTDNYYDLPQSAAITDFVTFKEGFLFVDCDGNIYENGELVLNCEITGDALNLEQISSDVFVVSNQQYAIHILWLQDEAFIVEKVELDMYEDIIILNDKTCPMRYFIYSKS